MYSCTNNLSLLLTFDMIICTKLQQTIIILHSIGFHCAHEFRKLMNLYLLVNLHNTLKDAKNKMFNLTTLLVQNKKIEEYT
jgi:hypothetical protein